MAPGDAHIWKGPVRMMTEYRWSKREKEIARKAFDAAHERECRAVAAELKKITAAIIDPEGLWRARDFITKRCKEIYQKYDYRYSVLPRVFGFLMREGWLTIDDLAGLAEDKMAQIKRIAEL
jgi:hypothetical protein